MTAKNNPNSFKITLGALIVLVFLFVAAGPMYILSEGEQAIVARFGRIIKTEYNAGLKFKVAAAFAFAKSFYHLHSHLWRKDF